MRHLLPKRPLGASAEAAYHQKIWDAIASLMPVRGPGHRTHLTTRGTVHEVEPGSSSSETTATGLIYKGEWANGYYKKDHVVTRLSESATRDGFIAGTYVAVADVIPGDDPPQEYDSEDLNANIASNPKWRRLARAAWKYLKLRADYILGSGEDAEQYSRTVALEAEGITTQDSNPSPQIVLKDTAGGEGIWIRLADANGLHIKFREVEVCVGDITKRMIVLGSEPYDPV